MWQLGVWTRFLIVLLAVIPAQRVTGCTCRWSHPQTQFCSADFVAVVRVKKEILGNERDVVYRVKVNKVFKADESTMMVLENNTLYTPPGDGLCGVNLNVGETYVVSGRVYSGKPMVTFCDLSMRWSDVTSGQRKGFRRLYRHGCVCEVIYTSWLRKGAVLETTGGKQCLWESTPGPQDCQEKYGVCMVGLSGCSWTPSVPYKNCIKEHQRVNLLGGRFHDYKPKIGRTGDPSMSTVSVR